MTDETQPENTQEEKSSNKAEMMEAGVYAAGGAAAGAGASVLGGIKLTIAGTIVGGMLPVAVIGAITGVAAYGVKKTFWDK